MQRSTDELGFAAIGQQKMEGTRLAAFSGFLSSEIAELSHRYTRLACWSSRKNCSALRCCYSFLRWMARIFRNKFIINRWKANAGRNPKDVLRQLEGVITSADSVILPNDQGILGESREICGHGSTTGKAQPRFGRGRVGVDTMPFLHLGVWRQGESAPDRKAIEEVLNRAKDWYRYAPNCWIIYTARSADWWYEKLSNISGMKDDASFLICETSIYDKEKRAGWLSQSAWDWINKGRASWPREKY